MDMLAAPRAARPLSRRRSIGRLAAREERTFWLFLLPWILGFIAFTGGPIIATLFLSLTDYTATTAPTWAGVHNYTTLFGDPLFQKSLLVTAYYTALSVPSGLVVSLALALLLNQRVRGRGDVGGPNYASEFYVLFGGPNYASEFYVLYRVSP